MTTKLFLDNLSNVFSVIAGAWILWNYFFKRSFAPKIRMNISGEILGKDISGQMMLRANLSLENVGEVRFKAKEILLTVRGILSDVEFKTGDEKILNQILFKDKIYQDNLVPDEWGYTFIDPGVLQDFKYTILIPKNYKYLLIDSKVVYSNKKDFQICSFLLKIENGK